ncbi:unnamed protein product [Toxocara canis]|uniref:Transport and Golgi organization protein 2-like protein n=1 Tax=Toxocara canis TaxID=6265 RepID=A0A183TX45_TOXCA|nr:unnamed protein product [Toxocara canis]
MCVTFVYIDHNPTAKYKLILLNNRDEFLDRATSEAKWERGILGGRDEKDEARGTWLCMDVSGRIANLLSITVPFHKIKHHAPSRGEIPIEFLCSQKSSLKFCESLTSVVDAYNAFQILCLERNNDDQYELCTLASCFVDCVQPIRFSPGIYGFGNSPHDKPFKKVQRGVELMVKVVDEINSEEPCEEKLRKQCRHSSEICKFRSSLYVQYPDGIRYGTRSHSIILVDRSNHVTFYEKRMTKVPKQIADAEWEEQTFHFDLKQSPLD